MRRIFTQKPPLPTAAIAAVLAKAAEIVGVPPSTHSVGMEYGRVVEGEVVQHRIQGLESREWMLQYRASRIIWHRILWQSLYMTVFWYQRGSSCTKNHRIIRMAFGLYDTLANPQAWHYPGGSEHIFLIALVISTDLGLSQLIIIQFLDITRVSPVRMTMMPRIIPPKLIVASIFHGCVRQAHNIMFFFKTYLEVEQSLESLVKST